MPSGLRCVQRVVRARDGGGHEFATARLRGAIGVRDAVRELPLERQTAEHRLGGARGTAAQDDCELVAADAAHDVAPDAVLKCAGERDQHLVADRVPVRVVHRLEVVEVQQQQGAVRAELGGSVEELTAVAEPGQGSVRAARSNRVTARSRSST